MSIKVTTKKGTWRLHEFCHGLEEIARVDHAVDLKRLEKFFPGVIKPGELTRPEKVELLISTCEGRLAPQQMMRRGDLVLWNGPLRKTISGVHRDLFEYIEVTASHSSIHFACSMRAASRRVEVRTTAACNAEIVKWLQWDSIGAACDPMCGGCQCGKCAPGRKEMSLAEGVRDHQGRSDLQVK